MLIRSEAYDDAVKCWSRPYSSTGVDQASSCSILTTPNVDNIGEKGCRGRKADGGKAVVEEHESSSHYAARPSSCIIHPSIPLLPCRTESNNVRYLLKKVDIGRQIELKLESDAPISQTHRSDRTFNLSVGASPRAAVEGSSRAVRR
jgi:hypothetical protein